MARLGNKGPRDPNEQNREMSNPIRQSHLGRKQAEGKGGKGKRVHEESEPPSGGRQVPRSGGASGVGECRHV